jgi:predicted transcriptional regulator/uncharacterized protein (DUF2267 family)
MTLEQYCSDKRMLIQSPNASAYEAARALTNQHVGAVIVEDAGQIVGILTDRDLTERVVAAELDPKETPLRDIMSPEPFTVSAADSEEQAIKLMRARHIRRVPIVHGSRTVGIVTLDDLLMTASVDVATAGDIVGAQLAEPAPEKPAVVPYPLRSAPIRMERASSERHRAAAAEQTLHEFQDRLRGFLLIDDPDRALQAFEIVVSALVRRVTPGEAQDFVSQLPSLIREKLLDLPAGPDRAITRASIEDEIERRLPLQRETSAGLLCRIAASMPQFVSPGAVQHLVDQLPSDLKELFS